MDHADHLGAHNFLTLTCKFPSITAFLGNCHFFKLSEPLIYFVEVSFQTGSLLKSSWLSLPLGLRRFFPSNLHFWIVWTCPFLKSVHFLIFGDFSKSGSPGQITMLTTSAAKFCVEPWSPFSNFSHLELKSIGKLPNIVSWPECQLEFFREALKSITVVRRAGSEGCTTASWNP